MQFTNEKMHKNGSKGGAQIALKTGPHFIVSQVSRLESLPETVSEGPGVTIYILLTAEVARDEPRYRQKGRNQKKGSRNIG